jgi:glutaredoxin 3
MKNIMIYTTPTCEWCKKTKAYLDKKGIQYINIDVKDDNFKIQEMVKKSGQSGVPVIDIEGQIIIGYNPQKIDELLSL